MSITVTKDTKILIERAAMIQMISNTAADWIVDGSYVTEDDVLEDLLNVYSDIAHDGLLVTDPDEIDDMDDYDESIATYADAAAEIMWERASISSQPNLVIVSLGDLASDILDCWADQHADKIASLNCENYAADGWELTEYPEPDYRSDRVQPDNWVSARAINRETGHEGLVWWYTESLRDDPEISDIVNWDLCHDIEDLGEADA